MLRELAEGGPRRMRYISVFSGIEAASVAWASLGWEPLAFCEIDEFPSAVLAHRFPDVENLGDITKVDWKEVIARHGRPDVVVGGSPCQSFSVTGGRESLRGESRLMFEYVRALDEIRPRWFLWENVPGVLNTRDNAFAQLLGEVSKLGYGSLAWRVLDAQFFGVAQRRRRVFLVGRLGNGGGAAAVLFEPESLRGDNPSSREKREALARAAGRGPASAGFCNSSQTAGTIGYEPEQHPTLRAGGNLASTGAVMSVAANQRGEVRYDGGDGQTMGAIPATRSGKQFQGVLTPWDVQSKRVFGGGSVAPTISIGTSEGANIQPCVLTMASGQAHAEIGEEVCPTQSARQYKDPPIAMVDDAGYVVRRITPVEAERLQGFPSDWTKVPYRGKQAKECPDTPRYKAVGNSMAVPVMRWIGRRMQMVDQSTTGHGPGDGQQRLDI